MFGKAKRRDAEAMESIREQLAAADMHARSVLSAVAQTESRWAKDRDERSRTQVSAERAIENVRSSVVENAADVGKTLQQVVEMCALVVERLEADTIERRALTEAITLLARQQSAPVDTPSRILGGTVLSSPEPMYSAPVPPNGSPSYGDASNGDVPNGGSRNGDIDLVSYEAAERVASSPPVDPTPSVEEPPRTIERFRPFAAPPVGNTIDPVQVLEPVEIVEPVRAAEPQAVHPVAVEPEPAVSRVPVAEPIAPAKPFDAFAGLPLLKPKPATPPVDVVEPASPFAAPAPPAPFAPVAPPAVPTPAAPKVSDGLEPQWSASYELTESNSHRPRGGTRLTPRRSNVRTPTS